jgi:hypothetical protein
MRRLVLALWLVMAVALPPVAAQAPEPWVKLAPFPEPAEELYGVAAGGKLYGAQWPRMAAPRHGPAGEVLGSRLHLVSGDVQSAGIPGMSLHSPNHDALEPAGR